MNDVLKIISELHRKKKHKGTDNELVYKLTKLEHYLKKLKKNPDLYFKKRKTVFENMKTIKKYADLIEELPDFEIKGKLNKDAQGVFQTEIPNVADREHHTRHAPSPKRPATMMYGGHSRSISHTYHCKYFKSKLHLAGNNIVKSKSTLKV